MQIKQENVSSVPDQRGRGWFKAVVLLISICGSILMFLTLDWLHSRRILRARLGSSSDPSCLVPDPVRHHGLKPNCSNVLHWGWDSFEVQTNSLGLRDQHIREVPRVGDRPRVLVLGDSFTFGMLAWGDSYVGQIAARFPQYEILNGGVESYSPSNYYNTTRLLLAQGVEFDEVIVFIDISDVSDEAHIYEDIDSFGAVTQRAETKVKWRPSFIDHLLITNSLWQFCKRMLVGLGLYGFASVDAIYPVDAPRSAWTYKNSSELSSFDKTRYSPLGVEGGIAKEKLKMTLMWEELKDRNIPISVVVYPWPAQVIHDTAESRQVRIWREWCEGRCKRFVSLFPTFIAVKSECPRSEPGCWYLRYFIFGDIHYNLQGNAMVADVVSRSLVEAPPVKLQVRRSSQ